MTMTETPCIKALIGKIGTQIREEKIRRRKKKKRSCRYMKTQDVKPGPSGLFRHHPAKAADGGKDTIHSFPMN